ncbi:MAG TPA: MOSC and FAD-binding oxidoreductase domain-containing protein [Solirubrobacteraceae bacterium]|nr:MOSC and FAD-binding oxidoreductase domain-containing protein [Solirubrobacteraceae bacterium]
MTGRLLSVNVGTPREVEWEGKTVRSAIWKQPVDGPQMVRKINIDGDDQADRAAHGGEHRAVFVYQIESYRYWERELGRSDFTYGQFGENFTVDGLADDEVCIGDRYRIGEAIFEVTQPRVTCFRVGIRMNEPAMPSLLVAHHRPGFYLRVLQEGLVAAGDEIIRLSTGPEQLTVAEIDGLLYLPNRSRRLLERALRIPALSDGWKGSFQELLDQGEEPEADQAAWAGFQPLKVTAVDRESATVVSLQLAPVSGGAPTLGARAGQYLTFRLRVHGTEQPPVIRSYSLSSIDGEGGYRVSVKREPDGIGSGFVHKHVHPGDVLDVAAPRGNFALREGGRPVALISAGIGATPMVAMLQALAGAHSDREVWWLHGARNGQEHVFADEVDRLLGSLTRVHRIVTYSRPAADDMPGKRFDAVGRLGIETIESAGIPVDADYYLCGPEAFMRTLSAGLTARGVPPEQITTEIFGPIAVTASGIVGADQRAPHQPDGPPGRGPAVTFARSGLTVAWEPSYSTLLEFAEACDVPVSFGCRTGVCHYCETEMLTGDVTYKVQPLEPPAEGRVLMCCTEPRTEVTLEL